MQRKSLSRYSQVFCPSCGEPDYKSSSSQKCINYCPSLSSYKFSNNDAYKFCLSIPRRNTKNNTWQRYGYSKRICAPEPYSNTADCSEPD